MGQTYIIETIAIPGTDYKHITIVHVNDDGSVTQIDGGPGDLALGGSGSVFGDPPGINTTNSTNGDLVVKVKEYTAQDWTAGGGFGSANKKLISEDDAVWTVIKDEAKNWGNEVTVLNAGQG